MPKPFVRRYPGNPQTIGDHIRKRRMDLGWLQKDVAKALGVTVSCVELWESNKSAPQIQHAPKIIKFLGYNPYPMDLETFGGRIKAYRILHGLSHKKMGELVDVNASTISCYETSKYTPTKQLKKEIEFLIDNDLKDCQK